MRKEIILIFVVGMFILTYVMDKAIDPLTLQIATPYHYLNPKIFNQYPFSTASVFIKALGITISAWLALSFMENMHLVKAAVLLVMSGLIQLYAVQNMVSASSAISSEWSLGLTAGGIGIMALVIFYFVMGILSKFAGDD